MIPPIIISGPPRSGTTWMQWFLSQHPRIHIHGQEPQLSWKTMLSWYDEMVKAGKWAIHANQHKSLEGYSIAHYAGSSPERCKEIFAKMAQDFLCGFGPVKPRWGIKSLWFSTQQKTVDQINSIWPETKWIICIRHPFVSFESQKNTFVPDMNLEQWIERWIESVQIMKSNSFPCIHMDQLQKEKPLRRRYVINQCLPYIGEEPTTETEEFLEIWPIVHKVKPETVRKFKLHEKRKQEMLNTFKELGELIQEMGYEVE